MDEFNREVVKEGEMYKVMYVAIDWYCTMDGWVSEWMNEWRKHILLMITTKPLPTRLLVILKIK
jgi:hypothetical protein